MKNIKTKVITILLIIIFSSFMLTGCGSSLKTGRGQAEKYGTLEMLQEFLSQNPDRTTFSDKEKEAGQWIKRKFLSFGYSEDDIFEQALTYKHKNQTFTSQNIILKKNASQSTDKTVIIGAHYDNLANTVVEDLLLKAGGEGAYDNGTGVSAMLTLAKYFYNKSMPFNIVFVAFGAEQANWLGSITYVQNMSAIQKKNTLLMVNLDMIGGGDYLYVYCDEVKTVHQDFITKTAKDNGLNINTPPKDKKTFSIPTKKTSYSHQGLFRDNVAFWEEDINIASLFSLNWHTTKKEGIMVESGSHRGIVNTKNDNLEKLLELYGEGVEEKMDTAVAVVAKTLEREDFSAAMEQSREKAADYSILAGAQLGIYIKLGLVALTILLVFMLIRNYSRKYPVPIIIVDKRQFAKREFDEKDIFGGEYGGKKDSNPFGDGYNNKDENNPFDGY